MSATSAPRIAIDAMGGDGGASVMIAGAALALDRNPALRFRLVGREDAIKAELATHPALAQASTIVHAENIISGDDKAAQAIRRAKTTSMGLAIADVKSGAADAAVSGGNTGALMAMSKLALRTMTGIDRPALAALMPTLGDNDVIMLDLGANTECEAKNLVEFAIMGAAYARSVLDVSAPRVRLLNIGTEELKGTEELRVAASELRATDHLHLRFDGFIEASSIASGDADVVVTDGFSGNIALKSIEGTARFITQLLRRAFSSSLRSKAGFVLSRPAFALLKVHLDPNNHNGAVFLGLNGIVVKSHGSADVSGVANAIKVASQLFTNQITRRITEDLDQIHARHTGSAVAAESAA